MIKKIIMIGLMNLFFVASWATTPGVVVKVNGMVCSFCSTSIEKKFKESAAVKNVQVDLENKKVTLKYVDNKELTESEIKDIITKAGYTVVAIEPLVGSDSHAVSDAAAGKDLKKK